MRFLLILLFPIILFSQQQIDTLRFEGGDLYSLRYITLMPADSAMSKSEMFMRGIWPEDEIVKKPWKRLDSVVVFNQAGERQAQDERKYKAEVMLRPGSNSRVLEWRDEAGEDELKLTFVHLSYDLMEGDFIADRGEATKNPWIVPEGRDVLYLRLESTEKLMTIYRDGRPFTKIAVGRQLDEVSLLALPRGDFMLEVIDLGTGQKRYHAIRR